MVIHLYDADSELGASLDLLLEAKAGSYMGTRYSSRRILRAHHSKAIMSSTTYSNHTVVASSPSSHVR